MTVAFYTENSPRLPVSLGEFHGYSGTLRRALQSDLLFDAYAKEEFLTFFAGQRNRCEHLTLIANSIGAFFALSALDDTLVDRAYLISPVVDMENLTCKMMQWSNVTEQELAEKREIATKFGETLSWAYLCYVREHPIIWNVPTCILYGEHDHLTSIETVSAFARQHHADLTVMPGGEHWFHTGEQMQFLDRWIRAHR